MSLRPVVTLTTVARTLNRTTVLPSQQQHAAAPGAADTDDDLRGAAHGTSPAPDRRK
jgi:hypothetical protein